GVSIPHIPFEEPLRLQCSDFIESIQTGSRPLCDGYSGVKVLHVLEQADRSLHEMGGRRELWAGDGTPAGKLALATNGTGAHSIALLAHPYRPTSRSPS